LFSSTFFSKNGVTGIEDATQGALAETAFSSVSPFEPAPQIDVAAAVIGAGRSEILSVLPFSSFPPARVLLPAAGDGDGARDGSEAELLPDFAGLAGGCGSNRAVLGGEGSACMAAITFRLTPC
jgi:hypothetical protein